MISEKLNADEIWLRKAHMAHLANFSGGSTTVTHHSQWTSADPSLATVADGLVTARASGSVQIAAAYGGTSATYTVKVQ